MNAVSFQQVYNPASDGARRRGKRRMIVTRSRLTPKTRLRRDLSPRRLAGSPSTPRSREKLNSCRGRVQVFMLDKSLPNEMRTPPPATPRQASDNFHLPQVFLTQDREGDQPRRPATTIPEIRVRRTSSDSEIDDSELQVRAIDLVAMANDEHRSSSSMTRHRLVQSMSEIDRYTPMARPHTVAVSERIMENRLMNLKYKQYPCIRAESILNEELTARINNLSRECCDVFGPNICQECKKIYQRNENCVKNESFFPSITISTTSISTLTLARRYMPNCSPWELQRMIAEGDIGELEVKRDKRLDKAREFGATVEEAAPDFSRRARRISAFNVPDKQRFFSSIADLRTQMEALKRGRRGRRRAVVTMTDDDDTPGHIPQEIDIEPVYDKEKHDERLGPPLMTCEEMVYQHNQPRFYAGTKFEYELPKPPPMAELIERATAAMTLMEDNKSAPLDAADALARNPEIEAWRKARQEYEKEKRAKANALKETPKPKIEQNSSDESESEDESETDKNRLIESENSQLDAKTNDNPISDVTIKNGLIKPLAREGKSARKRSVVIQPILEEETEESDS